MKHRPRHRKLPVPIPELHRTLCVHEAYVIVTSVEHVGQTLILTVSVSTWRSSLLFKYMQKFRRRECAAVLSGTAIYRFMPPSLGFFFRGHRGAVVIAFDLSVRKTCLTSRGPSQNFYLDLFLYESDIKLFK